MRCYASDQDWFIRRILLILRQGQWLILITLSIQNAGLRKQVEQVYHGHSPWVTSRGKPSWCLPRIFNGTNSPRVVLLFHQNFGRVKGSCPQIFLFVWQQLCCAQHTTQLETVTHCFVRRTSSLNWYENVSESEGRWLLLHIPSTWESTLGTNTSTYSIIMYNIGKIKVPLGFTPAISSPLKKPHFTLLF